MSTTNVSSASNISAARVERARQERTSTAVAAQLHCILGRWCRDKDEEPLERVSSILPRFWEEIELAWRIVS